MKLMRLLKEMGLKIFSYLDWWNLQDFSSKTEFDVSWNLQVIAFALVLQFLWNLSTKILEITVIFNCKMFGTWMYIGYIKI